MSASLRAMTDGQRALSTALIGTWHLRQREVRDAAGSLVASPLGEDPIGLLVYDGEGNFAAQFMRRDRDEAAMTGPSLGSAVTSNNTGAVAGYDAYFGRYRVDDADGTVTQTLVAALSPGAVGQEVTRAMTVEGDTLHIRVDTATPDGEPATITLRWTRATSDRP